MKSLLLVLTLALLGSLSVNAQALTGIWHCPAKKECIDFTPDGRFKIFTDKYVRYGRYKVYNERLYLKEIGSEQSISFNIVANSTAHFVISDDHENKKRFQYFDQTKMSQKEFQKAIAIYYERDQYHKRLVSNY